MVGIGCFQDVRLIWTHRAAIRQSAHRHCHSSCHYAHDRVAVYAQWAQHTAQGLGCLPGLRHPQRSQAVKKSAQPPILPCSARAQIAIDTT